MNNGAQVISNPIPKSFALEHMERVLVNFDLSREFVVSYIESMECIDGKVDGNLLTKFINELVKDYAKR